MFKPKKCVPKTCFFASFFSLFFPFFTFFKQKNWKIDIFWTMCAAPKCWLKYTTWMSREKPVSWLKNTISVPLCLFVSLSLTNTHAPVIIVLVISHYFSFFIPTLIFIFTIPLNEQFFFLSKSKYQTWFLIIMAKCIPPPPPTYFVATRKCILLQFTKLKCDTKNPIILSLLNSCVGGCHRHLWFSAMHIYGWVKEPWAGNAQLQMSTCKVTSLQR